MIFYGIKIFITNLGFFGPRNMCEKCQAAYAKWLIKEKRWIHIMFIPLIPAGSSYKLVCPACCNAVNIDKRTANALLAQRDTMQNVQLLFFHHVGNNVGYEIWMRDYNNNIDKCIYSGLNKTQINNFKRNLGFKNSPITEIQ